MIYLNKIPKKNKDIAWRIIGNEAVIIPLNNQSKKEEKIDILNETATKVWELIDGKNSIAVILKKLTCEYEIEPREAKSQTEKFLIKLAKKGLIDFKNSFTSGGSDEKKKEMG